MSKEDLEDLEDLEEGLEEVEEEAEEEEEEEAEEIEKNEETEVASTLSLLRDNVEKEASSGLTKTEEAKLNSAKLTPINFVTKGEDIDDILSTPEKFNTFMNQVVGRTLEYAFRTLPVITSPIVTSQVEQQVLVEKFYDKNSDLLPYRNTVRAAFTKLANENPDWDMKKVLDAAAVSSRQALKLKEKVDKKVIRAQEEQKQKKPIALPHIQRRSVEKTGVSKQQKLIASIL